MSTAGKTLSVILLYMVLVISYAAAGTTGVLVLRGYVPEISEIQVVSENRSTELDLAASSGMALVGTIKENSTSKETGYKVEISSKNAIAASSDSAYLMGVDTNEYVDYNILYEGEIVELNAGTAVMNGSNVSGRLMVAYDSVSLRDDSISYSDTLTISVIAN